MHHAPMPAFVTSWRCRRRVRAVHLATVGALGLLLLAGAWLPSLGQAQEAAQAPLPPASGSAAAPANGSAVPPASAPSPAPAPPVATTPPAPAAAVHVPLAVRRELNRAQSLLHAQLAHLPPEDGIELLRESESVILRVPARVLFRPDSKSLQTDAATQRVLALPERLLRRRHRLSARIEVYTDNIGGMALNLTLSEQRAQVLLAVLRRAGISAQRLQAQGDGLTAAISSNDTPEGRMRNRRVEFVFERAGTRRPAASAGPSGAASTSARAASTSARVAAAGAPLRPAQAAARAGA